MDEQLFIELLTCFAEVLRRTPLRTTYSLRGHLVGRQNGDPKNFFPKHLSKFLNGATNMSLMLVKSFRVCLQNFLNGVLLQSHTVTPTKFQRNISRCSSIVPQVRGPALRMFYNAIQLKGVPNPIWIYLKSTSATSEEYCKVELIPVNLIFQ